MVGAKSGVVLGYCEVCAREVSFDEEAGEFFYDPDNPLRLLAVFCPACALGRFGLLSAAGQRAGEAVDENLVDGALGKLTRGLLVPRERREKIRQKALSGRRVTGAELAWMVGMTPGEMRRTPVMTDAAERLRRYKRSGYRKVGRPPEARHRGSHLSVAGPRAAEAYLESFE